jgi:hypothetical protein
MTVLANTSMNFLNRSTNVYQYTEWQYTHDVTWRYYMREYF